MSREYAGIVAASADANADDEHDPEGATIAFERAQLGALLDQARRHLADLDLALGRVDRRGVRRVARTVAGPISVGTAGGAAGRPHLHRLRPFRALTQARPRSRVDPGSGGSGPDRDPSGPNRGSRASAMLAQALGVWRSLVACFVRDEEAAGSNPVTPTN